MNELISNVIKNFKNSYTLIESESLKLIDKIADIDTDILSYEPLKSFYNKDNLSVLNLIIFSMVFGIILYKFGKMILYLYNNCDWNYMSQIVIKAILILLISTNSNYIIKEIINLNFLFTETIESLFKDVSGEEICYDTLPKQVSTLEEFLNDRYKINIKDSSKIISCFLIISLLVIFSIRYVLIILSIILFPFLAVLLILDNGKYLFSRFFKFFIFNLLIQNINKAILFIPIASKKEEVYELILIGALLVLYNVNKSVINVGDIWKR